jgi:molybdate transport system regulatory protein
MACFFALALAQAGSGRTAADCLRPQREPYTPPMASRSAGPVARLRIVLGGDIALGPGKADLMEGIRDTGSIAAAGRRMGMSYKQAWLLVETMNACFAKPLVAAAKGGERGGGARLTPLGEDVLRRFQRMQASSARATAKDLAALTRVMRKAPR